MTFARACLVTTALWMVACSDEPKASDNAIHAGGEGGAAHTVVGAGGAGTAGTAQGGAGGAAADSGGRSAQAGSGMGGATGGSGGRATAGAGQGGSMAGASGGHGGSVAGHAGSTAGAGGTAAMGGAGGGGAGTGGAGGGVHMADVQKIFDEHCVLCHDATKHNIPAFSALPLTADVARASLVSKPATETCGGTLVVPGKPNESYLYLKVTQDTPCEGSRMPRRFEGGPGPMPMLSSDELDTLSRWIGAGAPQ